MFTFTPSRADLRKRINKRINLAIALGALCCGGHAWAASGSTVSTLNQHCVEKITSASYKAAQGLCLQAVHEAATHAAGQLEQVHALRHLAALDRDLGRFSDAQPLLDQALAIAEQRSGTADATPADHAGLVTTLSDVALLYQIQGRQSDAEKPLQRALALADKTSDADSRLGTEIRYRLGLLYYDQHRYTDAEPLLSSAVTTAERDFGSQDPTTQALRDALARVEKELAASAAPGLSNSIGPGPNP